MSESNTGNKETTKAATASKAKETRKAKVADKIVASTAKADDDAAAANKARPVEKVTEKATAKVTDKVAASEVKSKIEAETAAPYMAPKKLQEKTTSYAPYYAAAAGILLVVTLSVATFFQDEYKAVVASASSMMNTGEVATAASRDVSEADSMFVENGSENNNIQGSNQIAQADFNRTQPVFGKQPHVMNQTGNPALAAMRQKHQTSREEAMRRHDERMAKVNASRAAMQQRMDQTPAERRMKMEVLQAKTQQIQLEMRQKMQAAYDEFHAI